MLTNRHLQENLVIISKLKIFSMAVATSALFLPIKSQASQFHELKIGLEYDTRLHSTYTEIIENAATRWGKALKTPYAPQNDGLNYRRGTKAN